MLLITAFFSSILALIFYKLSINVIRLRRKYKVSLGSSKKHKDLDQANYWFEKAAEQNLDEAKLMTAALALREPNDVDLYIAN